MYLHLGQNTVVTTGEIIGFFDMDNTTVSKTTRDFLSAAERGKRVKYVSYDLPKSFVLTSEYGFSRVRLTSLSSSTLEKRLK